ncbi:hypothetical protein Vretimale_16959 [Volvox reticuliferus]|uniref:GS catalytic domain-containing protein n=1 Tax=Volvox reticuliferus TaxID=1737510 RepID=A0A8J4FTX4_9CHLO|nr:hypothetical protein Vretifemale_16755 [Volvox reticuliferus]GIM13900.1 hypothetical protein Vretimale_16959 [Volvox reticuliferus]
MGRFLKALDFTTHTEAEAPAASTPLLAENDSKDHAQPSGQLGTVTAPVSLQSSLVIPEHGGRQLDISQAKAIRLLWCDTAGIRRCRVVPPRRYEALHTCGLGITTACMAMPAYGDFPAPNAGLTAVGEARMKPVESTRVALPWSPGHHMVLVEFEAPRSETPWDCCPRRALRNTCKMLQENFGLTMKVGFELEFLLLERAPESDGGIMGSGWGPVDSSVYCQSSALDSQAKVLDQVIDTLEAMGIEVVQWHAESAPGQYEISLMHGDTVEAADKLLLAKEALVAVAGSHGLAVSFLPKPVRDAAGNGLHVHLSLWKDGKCLMHDPQGGGSYSSNRMEVAAAAVIAAAADLTPSRCVTTIQEANPTETTATASPSQISAPPSNESQQYMFGFRLPSRWQPAPEPKPEGPAPGPPPSRLAIAAPSPQPIPSMEMLSFLAGVLTYIDVLLPFTSPSPNSYDRLHPGAWAGAYAAWGYNNREVPLRVTAPGPNRLDMMHLEYKALDGTANPYVALSAIMVAGMLGVFAKLFPPEPCQVPPHELDTEASSRLGIRLLPNNLRAALDLLQNSQKGEAFKEAMAEAISQPLLQAFLAVREAEALHVPHDDPRNMLLRYS